MTSDLPELRSSRLALRRPLPQDVGMRLSLVQHREIIEAYGGTFNPDASFTQAQAEAAIRSIENQKHAWVLM